MAEAEKELSNRFVSYSGEEVPKMQVLSMAAAKGGLLPRTHGGPVDALAFQRALDSFWSILKNPWCLFFLQG